VSNIKSARAGHPSCGTSAVQRPGHPPPFAKTAKERGTRFQSAESKARATRPIKFAREYLRAGHKEEALRWLTLACEERNVFSLMIACDPFYDSLRSDQHFKKLLRRMRLDSGR
jgi:hypothetical protein